jgi:hypothetical protein
MVMDEQVATDYVVRELGKHRNRSDIIVALCQHDLLSWDQADAFVSKVEKEQRRRIAGGQATLLIILGLGTIVFGMFLVFRYLVATINGTMILQWPFPVPYLGNVVRMGTGALMVLGGFFGILKVVWDLLG